MDQDDIRGLIATGISLLIALATVFGAYWKARNQIDGLGQRTNEAEKDIASLRGQVGALKDEIRDDRLAIMTQLHNSEKAAQERESRLREQLARIEERMNVDRMVEMAVKKLDLKRGE